MRIAEKKLSIIVYLLILALTVVVAWPFFTTTVEAGHVGVYFSRFFGGTVLGKSYMEGLHFVLPWDSMIQYDRRLQSKEYSVTALTRGGLSVNINMSVLWFLTPEKTSYLHVDAGPEYRERVIDPAVISAVRSVIGGYEQSDLYDENPLKLQDDVLRLLNDTLKNASFSLHSILIREVKLPDKMSMAISDKFVAEQGVLKERYRVLEAIESFKRSYVDAESTRLEQSVISEGLSEEYLRYMGILATLELSKSDNAKLVIIGDKDGLPLILNTETMETSPVLPDGIEPEEYIRPGQEGARREELIETYGRLQEYLGTIDDVLGDVVDDFPEAEEGIGDSDLSQDNQVPTVADSENDTAQQAPQGEE